MGQNARRLSKGEYCQGTGQMTPRFQSVLLERALEVLFDDSDHLKRQRQAGPEGQRSIEDV